MSTSFEFTMNFRHSPEEVLSMLLSESFQKSQASDSDQNGALIERLVLNTKISHRMRESIKVGPKHFEFYWNLTQIWPNSLDEQRVGRGDIAIKVEGWDAEASAITNLKHTLTGAQINLTGEIRVTTPPGGKLLEKRFVSEIKSEFRKLEDEINELLDK